MIIPMLCVTIFVILVVWFLLPRVARLMIHTPTARSEERFSRNAEGRKANDSHADCYRSEERFSRNAETDIVCRLLLEKKNILDSIGHLDSKRIHGLWGGVTAVRERHRALEVENDS